MVDKVRQFVNQNIEDGLNSKDAAKQLAAANAAMMLLKHDSEKQQKGALLNPEEMHTQALAVRAMKTVEPGKTESEKSFTSLTGLDEVAKLRQQLSDYRNGRGNLTEKGASEVARELALRSNGPQMSAPPTPEEIAYNEEQKLQLQNNIGIATAGVGAAPAAAAAGLGAPASYVRDLLNWGAGAETGVEGVSIKLARSPHLSLPTSKTTGVDTSNGRGPYGGDPFNGPALGMTSKGFRQKGSVGWDSSPPDGQSKSLHSNGADNVKTAAGVSAATEGMVNEAQPQQATPPSILAGGISSSGGAQSPAGALPSAPVELKEVKLPPMQVTLADGSEKSVPVNLLIREQDMFDPATGKPRNFDGMGDAIQPHLQVAFEKKTRNAKAENPVSRQFEALRQLDVIIKDPVVLNVDPRYLGGLVPTAANYGVPELLVLGHTRNLHNNGRTKIDISQAPMRAFMFDSYLVPNEKTGVVIPTEPGAGLSIKSFYLRTFLDRRTEFSYEQQTLAQRVNDLTHTHETRVSEKNKVLYQGRLAHNQAIMQQLDARTEGYEHVSQGGARNTAAKVRHMQTDSTVPSPLPELYQPHHELKYGVPVTMKTISLPAAAGSDIPVSLTLPGEMEQRYLKIMDGKGGILSAEAMPAFKDRVDLQALSQAVIEQVELAGGKGAGIPMTVTKKDAITQINVIYLGTRRIAENPTAISHTTIQHSDDRMVVVAHLAAMDGRELPPIVLNGALYQKDSLFFQKQVKQGTLAAEAPHALTLSRMSTTTINRWLGEDLEILAKQAHWYATGDDPAPRHDASLYPRGPNEQQSASYAQRYEEVKAALEAFNQEALRYRAPAEQSATVAPDVKTRDVKTSAPDIKILDDALWLPQYNDPGPGM